MVGLLVAVRCDGVNGPMHPRVGYCNRSGLPLPIADKDCLEGTERIRAKPYAKPAPEMTKCFE